MSIFSRTLSLFLSLCLVFQTGVPAHGQTPAGSRGNSAATSTSTIPADIRSLLVAARSDQANTGESIEEQLEEEHLQRIKEMERDFLETAPDPEVVDTAPISPREELNQMP